MPYWLQVAGIVGLILINAGQGVVNPVPIRSIFDKRGDGNTLNTSVPRSKDRT